MAKWNYIKRSFSGGEIDARSWMRDDDPMFQNSVASMQNYYPTLQGSAVRTPGTRFIQEIQESAARIIPYYTPANERALVLITPASAPGAGDGKLQIFPDITSVVTERASLLGGTQLDLKVATPVYIQKVQDQYFTTPEYWDANPLKYPVDSGDMLGWDFDYAGIAGAACQLSTKGKKALTEATISQAIYLAEATTSLQIDIQMRYLSNFGSPDGAYQVSLSLGTAPGGSDIWEDNWDQNDHVVGYRYERLKTIPVVFGAGTTVYFQAKLLTSTSEGTSLPLFAMDKLRLLALIEVDVGESEITDLPYTADEIQDLQYVQSPYEDLEELSGKYLVITHPSHPPYWLQFTGTGGYEFVQIPFYYTDLNTSAKVPWTPDQWVGGNYPAACTSFHGRLILAGSQNNPLPGSATGSATETVWGSVVGSWAEFNDPNDDAVNPDDALEFTSIYRSPIQWVYGQKDLLIGAREMEYVASADGIFQPADIGVFMHSTHGSVNVQPVGLGQTIVFPAEGGTRLRAMNFQNDDQGYVAPDLSYYNPLMLTSGIKRMVRLRQPHQMVISLLGNGQLAILHFDPYSQIKGMSRYFTNATIKDICVIPDENGIDVLFLTVSRKINGQKRLYLEALSVWAESSLGEYLQSATMAVVGNFSLITGLDHLEGQNVQVVGDNNYLGVYTVVNGVIGLVDQIGQPINVSQCLVGLPYSARMVTLPLIAKSPGGSKRFTKITVRGLLSTRVKINGERSPDRDPATPQDTSQSIDLFQDYEVAHLGTDKTQFISIEEDVPLRSEILGVWGEVSENSV